MKLLEINTVQLNIAGMKLPEINTVQLNIAGMKLPEINTVQVNIAGMKSPQYTGQYSVHEVAGDQHGYCDLPAVLTMPGNYGRIIDDMHGL